MSSPASLLEAVAERLIPLFLIPGATLAAAKAAAIDTIRSYNPQSPADYASIGRILAFSLAAITVIGKSADPACAPNLQLRYLGKANTLGRSAAQAERTLAQRNKVPPAMPEPKTRPAAPPLAQHHPTVLADVDACMQAFTAALADPGRLPASRAAGNVLGHATRKPPTLRQTLLGQSAITSAPA